MSDLTGYQKVAGFVATIPTAWLAGTALHFVPVPTSAVWWALPWLLTLFVLSVFVWCLAAGALGELFEWIDGKLDP